MRIAYLVVRSDHASVRYRTIQYLPSLAREGIESSLIPIPNSFHKRLSLFRSLHGYDLVLLQRKLFNLMNFLPLKRHARKLIYDLDDALLIKDSKSPTSFSFTRLQRFRRTVRSSDFAICGNDWIRDQVRGLNPNTAVIPTVVDLSRYETTKRHESSPSFVAVWIGGRSTLFYLENILPALEPLGKKIRGFKLRVISDRFPESRSLCIEKIPWSQTTEGSALCGSDVGLMPLRDDDWSKGKCGLKLLQYGASGLPSVCSPVGVNQVIVKHGRSGFYARDPEEWQKALITLAQDVDLRARMGREARNTVEACYSLQAHLFRYISILKRIAGVGS